MNNPIDQAANRARRYWYVDGLNEIAFGGMHTAGHLFSSSRRLQISSCCGRCWKQGLCFSSCRRLAAQQAGELLERTDHLPAQRVRKLPAIQPYPPPGYRPASCRHRVRAVGGADDCSGRIGLDGRTDRCGALSGVAFYRLAPSIIPLPGAVPGFTRRRHFPCLEATGWHHRHRGNLLTGRDGPARNRGNHFLGLFTGNTAGW